MTDMERESSSGSSGDRRKTGCLLIHGFGGSPFEMEPLMDPLESMGCLVRNILLPGHDTTPDAWSRTSFKDWKGHAEAEFLRLQQGADDVFVMGLSMGGSLALHLAQRFDLAGVVAISAPVWLYRLFPPLDDGLAIAPHPGAQTIFSPVPS